MCTRIYAKPYIDEDILGLLYMYPHDRQGASSSELIDELRGRGFTQVKYENGIVSFSIFSRGEKREYTYLDIKTFDFDFVKEERDLVREALKAPE